MKRKFADFEEVPLPAVLLVSGGFRGNLAARETFGENLNAAGASLIEAIRAKKINLDTQSGICDFKLTKGHVEEGPMVWLIVKASGGHWELEELKNQYAYKTQFLNMAAHELNTPLTPIRLQEHLLTTEYFGKLNPEQQQAHKVISRNLDRMTSLISDILEVARLESKELKVLLVPMNLAELVRDTIESYHVTAEQAGVLLTSDLPEQAIVQGSKNRISQVIDNLVSNAIKFTPEGGSVHINIAGGDNAILSVRDTGLGLTSAQMSKLFQPFSQVHEGNLQGGTGLGLFICKGILEAHGQTIKCESKGAGKGSRFWFSLATTADAPID